MSQTIDSRVVEMKFDNSNFESNVSQSMSTLDKLKNALKFDGASDGLESVSKAAKSVDVSSLGNAVDEVGVKFSSLQVIGTTALANLTNSVVNAGKSIVSSITSAIGEGGLTRALNLEQAQFMFEGLGMKVDEAMASCNDAVLGTAYSLDQAAMAAAQFGASGMQAGDDMTSALRAIAGVAAMTGSEYSDIANIFTTVAGNGRLMGDQLLQLSYRGMNAAATLAKYLGTTEEEVRSMVTAGEIDFETFYKAMDEAFGEHAKDANETFTGALANMKAAAARIGAEFYTPVLESSRKLFNAFTPVIDAIHTGLIPAIESLTGFIDKCFSKMIIYLGNLENGGIDAFFDDLYNKFSLSDAAGQNLNYTLTGMFSIFQLVGQGVGAVINVISELASFIAPAVLAITAPIGELFTYINNFFQRWNIFGKIGDSIVSVLETLKNAFGDIWKALTSKFNIFSLVGQFFDGLNEFMSSSNFSFFQNVAEIISSGINKIKDAIVKFIDFIPGDFLMSVIGAPFALLGSLLSSVGIDFSSFTRFVYSSISVVENAAAKVGEFIQSFINLPQVQSIITGFSETIENTFGKLKDFFSGLVEQFNKFVEGVQNIGSIRIGDIGTIISNFVTDVLGYFKNLGNCFGDISGTVNKFIEGFKEGLSTATSAIGNFINSVLKIATTIKEKLNINLGSVLMVGIGAVIIWLIKQISRMYGSFSNLAGSVTSLVDGVRSGIYRVTKALKGMLNSMSFENYTEGIKNIAESVLMLSIALIALAQVDVSDLEKAGAALGGMAAGLIILAGAMTAFSKISGGNLANILNGVFFMELAGSILILAAALKMLDSIDSNSMLSNLAILAVLLVGLTAAIGALNKIGGGFQASAGTIIAIAASIFIIVQALNQLSDISFGNIVKSLFTLGIIMGLLTAVIKSMTSSSIAGAGFSLKSGVGIIGVAVAIELLISALKRIADMKPEDLVVGLAGLTSLVVEVSALLIACGLAGGNAASAGVGILAISASLILLSEAIKLLGEMNPNVVERGIDIIKKLSVLFGAFMVVSGIIGNEASQAAKLGAEMLLISAALLLLSGVIVILGSLDADQIAKGVTAIGALMVCFSLMIAATSLVSEASTKMKSTLTAMTIAIVALSVCIGVLAMIDPSGLDSATKAISMVMAVFALCVAATGLAKGAVSSVALMTVALVAITICLAALGNMNPESVLASAAGLSVVLLAISAALVVMETIGNVAPMALAAVGVLTLVVAALAIVLYQLNELDAETALATALSLSTMLLSMSAALAVLTVVGAVATAALSGLGIFALFVVEMGIILVAVGALADKIKPLMDKAIPILEEFGTVLGTTIGNIVSGFLNAATSSLADVGDNLSAFMDNMSGFIEGAKSITGDVVSGIDNLCEALVKLGAADLINAIEAFLGGGGDNFASLGERLSNLGDALSSFYGSMSTVGDMDRMVKATESAKYIADMLEVLPSESDINKSMLSGDLNGFSDHMEEFGNALSKLSGSLGDADINKINEAASCGQALNDLISNLPGKSWKETLLGDDALSEFSDDIKIFGDALSGMAETLGDVNLSKIDEAASCGQALNDLISGLPTKGGWKKKIIGDSDFNEFAYQIELLAYVLKDMGDVLADVDFGPINEAASAGQALSDLVNSLPSSEGALQTILGSKDFDTFASGIEKYAEALSSMSGYLGEDVDIDKIKNAAEAGKALTELCDSLPDSGGILDSIFGSKGDLGTFSENLKTYADALGTLSESSGNINAESFNGIVEATKSLNGMEFPDFTSSTWESLFTEKENISNLGSTLESLATAFSVYSGILSGTNFNTELVTSATNAIVDMGSSLNNMETIDSGTVQQFVDSLNALSEIELGDFVESISEVGPKLTQAMTDISTAFSDPSLSTSISDSLSQTFSTGIDTAVSNVGPKVSEAVSSIMSQFSSGLTDASSGESISSVFTSAISAAVSSISGYSSSFYSAGQSLGSQLISGAVSSISGGSSKISSAANGLVSAFSKGLSGSSGISSAFNSAIKGLLSSIKGYNSSFKSAGQTLATNVASGITAGNSKCKTSTTTVVKNALTVIKSQNSAFKSAGRSLASNLASGISGGKSSVTSAARSAASGGTSAIRGYYSNWRSAGGYLVQGFANGIRSKVSLAKSAAASVARSATSSLNNTLVEKSPSKVTYKSGVYFVEGFVNALLNLAFKASDAASQVGNYASNGLANSISKISDFIEDGIDINPTITPVLDLTNVESGAGRINTLLSGNGTLGLAMNSANWISGSMNSREDPNSELISAIRKLGRTISDEPRSVTNNTINGVSYDDGSEIQGAIETLVHAAKVGGRI